MAGKGARKTGGTAGRKRAEDSAMAARIKDQKRTTMRCPCCSRLVSIDAFGQHLYQCR